MSVLTETETKGAIRDIEDAFLTADFDVLERTDYSIEYAKKVNGEDKRAYIDFTEGSVAIDVYNSKDKLIFTNKTVLKHQHDVNAVLKYAV
jgi:hypothetical protein